MVIINHGERKHYIYISISKNYLRVILVGYSKSWGCLNGGLIFLQLCAIHVIICNIDNAQFKYSGFTIVHSRCTCAILISKISRFWTQSNYFKSWFALLTISWWQSVLRYINTGAAWIHDFDWGGGGGKRAGDFPKNFFFFFFFF